MLDEKNKPMPEGQSRPEGQKSKPECWQQKNQRPQEQNYKKPIQEGQKKPMPEGQRSPKPEGK